MAGLTEEEIKQREEEIRKAEESQKAEAEKLAAREKRASDREKELAKKERDVEEATIPEQVEEYLQSKGIGKGGGGLTIRGVLIPLVISIIVVFAMSSFGLVGVSVGQFNESMTAIGNDMRGKIDSSALEGYVTGDGLVTALSGLSAEDSPLVTDGELATALEGLTAPDLTGYVTQANLLVVLDEWWEAKQESNETNEYEGETTRWRFKEIGFTSDVPEGVYISFSGYDRIEEEDLYDVEVEIRYDDLTDPPTEPEVAFTSGIEMVLVPNNYVAVNTDATYLDSDDSPWLSWDTDFVLREREGVDVCRRIIFTSDDYLWELDDGKKIELDLVLELAYG